MNRVFKIVWNIAASRWVVTSELGKNRHCTRLLKASVVGMGLTLSAMSFASDCQGIGNTGIVANANCTTPIEEKYKAGEYTVKDVTLLLMQKSQEPSYGAIGFGIAGAAYNSSGESFIVNIENITLLNERGKSGIWVGSNWKNGDAVINLKGTNNITLKGNTDTAVLAEVIDQNSYGNARINVQDILNINHTETSFSHDITDGLEVRAKSNHNDQSIFRDASIIFKGNGTIATKGGNAIVAELQNGNGNVVVNLESKGGEIKLETNSQQRYGQSSHGIQALTQNFWGVKESQILVNSDAMIHIQGKSGQGIQVKNGAKNGTINVKNSGDILVSNKVNESGHGVYSSYNENSSQVTSLVTKVINSGNIKTYGDDADALYIRGKGQTDIINSGDLTTKNYGIYVQQYDTQATTTITSSGVINAEEGGIYSKSAGAVIMTLDWPSLIQGGEDFGVKIEDAYNIPSDVNHIVFNAGTITALNDLAIDINSQKSTIVNNSGIIVGRMSADAKMDLNNSGIFELRHIEDGHKRVAVSQFAGGTINNSGIIKFGNTAEFQSYKNDSNRYSTHYGKKISSVDTDLVQAHLKGVNTFNHSGTIDLRNSDRAPGNILRISGDHKLGTFVSNGGQLFLSTMLNAGGQAQSLSDVLVLDNVQLGRKATDIYIFVADGSQRDIKTVDNGILLVQVLGDKIDPNAFRLANGSFIYGLYEYGLVSVTDQPGKNGFYLQNGTEKTLKPENHFDKETAINLHPTKDLPWTPINPDTNVMPWTPINPDTNVMPLTPINPDTNVMPWTPINPDTNVMPLTPINPDTNVMPLTPINPDTNVMPLTPINPDTNVMPLTPINPDTNVMPLTPINPDTNVMPLTPINPDTNVMPWTPINPDTNVMPLTPINPDTNVMPLTPINPDTNVMPLTPINPDTNVMPWTPINPDTNVMPLTPINPDTNVMPLTPINPDTNVMPLTPINPDTNVMPWTPINPDTNVMPETPIDPLPGQEGVEGQEGHCAVAYRSVSAGSCSMEKPDTNITEDQNTDISGEKDNKSPVIRYSPNVGGYLVMQHAAAHMFDQNILDRRDNVRKPDENVWGRIEHSEAKGDHFNNSQSLKIDSTLIQLGWDIFQNEEKTTIFGIYAGYGNSDIKNRSHFVGREAKGNVKGYQIGAYYSWMEKKIAGTYVDVWGHFAKYRNKLEGETQNYKTTGYNGHGFSISAEVGHGFVVNASDNGNTQWILEPHAQVTYNSLKNRNVTDATGTHFAGNKAKGFDTRLGARFYGYREGDDALRPYIELNWLHNGTSNLVQVNDMKVSSRIARNAGELKLGFQGNISKDISISAHIGFQKGKENYKRTEAQVVFNYNF